MTSNGNSEYSRPADNEIEFSLFGPRYGESTLIHYGNGHWLVIDSCLSLSGRPAALDYLEKLGVDPKRSVRFVMASHFDDDHIRGLSDILVLCENARFALSSALSQSEFQAFLKPSMALNAKFPSGVSELAKCLRIVRNREANSIVRASANKALFREWDGGNLLIEVVALAPSDELVRRTIHNLVNSVPEGPRVRMVFNNNDLSVVSLIKAGPIQILHGADLEHRPGGSIGWLGILNDQNREPINASFYKISHHGSESGDHDQIWDEFLDSRTLCALAPFSKGRGIPTEIDKNRLLNRGNSIYSSTKVVRTRFKPTDNTVARTLKDGRVKMWSSNGLPGQIRFRARKNTTSNCEVALFEDACELRSVVTS